MQEILDMILAQRDREASLPIIGSKERPYQLLVPFWLEERAKEQGTTCQALADDLFRVAVDVQVVGRA